MSGPKTSRYRLTVAQWKKMEEQLQIIKEIRAAQDRNTNLKQCCKNSIAGLSSSIGELERISDESGYEVENTRYLKQRKNEILAELSNDEIPNDLTNIQSENDKLEKSLQEIRNLFSKCRVYIANASDAYKNDLSDIIADGFELSFSNLENNRKIKDNIYADKINTAIREIEKMTLPPELVDRFEELKLKAKGIKNIDFLENFYFLQMCPFIHECEFYRNHKKEFEKLISQYKYLAAEAGEAAKNHLVSETSLIELKEEIIRLDQIVMDQKAQEYINHAVDEAMVEMGYELVGERSVTKKSGKKFKNGLYALESGTAVNVTFSASGQISMELGALDVIDRIPTETEAAELADDMRDFCSNYERLGKKLAEKGIITKNVSALPPDAEYAQVFNTTDYELKRPLDISRKEKRKTIIGKRRYSEG